MRIVAAAAIVAEADEAEAVGWCPATALAYFFEPLAGGIRACDAGGSVGAVIPAML